MFPPVPSPAVLYRNRTIDVHVLELEGKRLNNAGTLSWPEKHVFEWILEWAFLDNMYGRHQEITDHEILPLLGVLLFGPEALESLLPGLQYGTRFNRLVNYPSPAS